MTLLSLILFLASCQTSDYTLNISVDAEDNNNVFLIALDNNNQPQTLDTLAVQGGVASYTGTIELPEMHYLLLDGNRDVVPVVLEPGEITVEIYKDSIRSSKASGTKSNSDFRRYIKTSTPLIDDLFGIQKKHSEECGCHRLSPNSYLTVDGSYTVRKMAFRPPVQASSLESR